VITRDLSDAIRQALDTGHAIDSGHAVDPALAVDPGLRSGGEPGQYFSSAAFAVAKRDGAAAEAVARTLAASLREQD
jgi:hypothetical protein